MWLLVLYATTATAGPVELPTTGTLGSSRIRGMGGAFTGVAESAAAQLINPASLAIRRSMVEPPRTELDGCIQARAHPWLHTPPAPFGMRSHWQACGTLRHEGGATGVHLREHMWSTPDGQIGTSEWSIGAGFTRGEWAVGVLPHVAVLRHPVERGFGLGVSAGGLWAPSGSPLRLGARTRSPVRTAGVRTPAQVAVGASYALGATNAVGRFGPARQQSRWGAPWALVAVDVVWTGSSADAVAIGPLLSRAEQQTSVATVATHAGLEVWAHQQDLRVRVGAYTTPGRRAGPAQFGVALGASAELLQAPNGTGLRVTGAVDGWRGTLSWTLGVETW